MMRCYKVIEDGYIIGIGTGRGGAEITETEYAEILAAIQSKPEAGEGYDWRMKEDQTWEKYDTPVIDPAEEEISDTEALDIITGVRE